MNGNLFVKEFKRNLATLGIWTLLIAILIALTMPVYNTFIRDQSEISKMMGLVPEFILKFRGISDYRNLFTPLGFYTANNTVYLMLLGSVYAIILSSGILLKEEYGKTAEFLLSKPLTRGAIFWTKWGVFSLDLFGLNLISSLVGLLSILRVQKGIFPWHSFEVLSLYTWLLNYLFGSLGLFLSTLVRHPKSISNWCIGLVLALYLIFTISRITPGASDLGDLSPFKFVDTDVFRSGYGLSFLRVLYFGGASLVLNYSAYRIYRTKDIYT